MSVIYTRVALIGLGLIAGSMAHAMRRAGLAGEIVGSARSPETRAIAAEIGDGGSGKLKAMLTESLNATLAPLRARRAELAKDPGYIAGVIKRGTERANAEAEATLAAVRQAMGMVYC